MAAWGDHLRDGGLRVAFAIGFCILFAFIGTFTFVNFVLVRPPLSLGMMQLGLVYVVFLPSILTTPRPMGSGAYSLVFSWMFSRTISRVTLLTRYRVDPPGA